MSATYTGKTKAILIIEDNHDIVDLIQLHLEDMDFKVDKALDGKTGLEKALENQYDLILLDLTLPYMDGLDICRNLRESGFSKPIMMMTARSEEIDKVTGMGIGINYYLTKPFSIKELKTGINKLLATDPYHIYDVNRHKFECTLIEHGQLKINTEKREVRYKSELLKLEEKEYLILVLLACQPGKVFSRSEILHFVWGFDLNTLRHIVTSYIGRLRKKIEVDFQNPKYILSSENGGYKFMLPSV